MWKQMMTVVVGLGLIGQIAVRLLKLQGARVFGTDLDPEKCRLAIALGADEAAPACPDFPL